MRTEFQRREATFKRREEMLKKKDLELQESLIKFNKFLQENDSKRGRAEKKEKEEIKQRLVKEQEITKLHEALKRQKAEARGAFVALLHEMQQAGFLIGWEGLLSAIGKDLAMLGDARAAIDALAQLRAQTCVHACLSAHPHGQSQAAQTM